MKQNNIQIPEGYINSSLGIIPNDWEVKKLGEVCKVNQGLQIPIDKRLTKYINGSYQYITIQYLNNKKNKEFILNPQESVICSKEDILMTRTGNTGIVISNVSGVFHNNFFKIDYNKSILYKNYLIPFLRLRHTQHILLVKAGTSTIPDLNHKDFYSIYLTLPPLPQQQKIAEILGTWDETIEKQSTLINKLTERKRGLMQQLLTGKKRLAGFNEEWKEVKLGEICERVLRKNTEKNHNIVTISAQQGFVSQKDYFNKNIASEITDNYYLIHKDEFCYNKSYSTGYPMGAIKRLKTFNKAVVTTLYICFKVKDNTCKNFFEQFSEGGNLIRGLIKVANEGGRAHGLLNVTPIDFFNIKLNMPSLAEQTAISNILTAADKEIELAKSKLELLRSQKSGLMQQLLTGKTRVKID